MQDQFDSELMYLAGGKQSEKESIQRLTLSDYFTLLKFMVDKSNREAELNKASPDER